MYQWIWRHLPGPAPARAAEAVLLAGLAVALLLFVVFPWLDPYLAATGVTVGSGGS